MSRPTGELDTLETALKPERTSGAGVTEMSTKKAPSSTPQLGDQLKTNGEIVR